MTCKTYSLKAFIDFFCWHPIFWRRSSLIGSHRTELFFFLAADFPNFVLIFTEVFIFWAALQHIYTFLCVSFAWIFVLFFAHSYYYLLLFWVINIACVLIIFLSTVKLFMLRSFAFPNCIVTFTSHDELISQKAFFFSHVFLRLTIQQFLKKFLKIKTPTRKKCSKSKVLFLTLFTEHQFWCHRIRFHVHSKNSLFEKRVVHFLTSCQKVNIAFFALFQDFSVKCRIHMFSLPCEVESDSANPFM